MDDAIMSRSRRATTRVLAISGTALAAVPLLAPLGLGLVLLVAEGALHLDLLMPGELFVFVLAGGALLVAAALLVRRRRPLVVVCAALPVALFLIVTLLTAVTGIGSGTSPASGWRLALVVGAYSLYVAAAIALVVVGVILCVEAFRRTPATGSGR